MAFGIVVTLMLLKLPVAVSAVTLLVFIGFSRLLLQVHYLSDVLGRVRVGRRVDSCLHCGPGSSPVARASSG